MMMSAKKSRTPPAAPKVTAVPHGTRPIEVLLAEDDQNDTELIRSRFRQARLAINLHHVENGEECLAFLRKQGKYAAAPTVDLLFLDLHMPLMTGKEVLVAIAADEALRHLPVVVLTTPLEAEYVRLQHGFRKAAYAKKPIAFEEFVRIIRAETDFWFTVVAAATPGKPEGSH